MTNEQKTELYQSLLKAIEDYDSRYDGFIAAIDSIYGKGKFSGATLDDLYVTGWDFHGTLTIESTGAYIYAKVWGDYRGDYSGEHVELDGDLHEVNIDGDELPDCTFKTLPKILINKVYKSYLNDKEEFVAEVLDNLDEEKIDINEAEEYLNSIFEFVLSKRIAEPDPSKSDLKALVEKSLNDDPDLIRYMYEIKHEDYSD